MELRYNLLTFTVFIIQSQVGAIPVFSRLFESQYPAVVGAVTAEGKPQNYTKPTEKRRETV